MGVLTATSNRKRAESDQPFTPISKSPNGCQSKLNFDHSHVSKKPKVSNSSVNGNRAGNSSSVSSRLQLYPCVIKEIEREVHAPVRIDRFGFSAKKEGSCSGDRMGNFLSRKYEFARRSVVGSLRYIGRGKEVIDVDEEGGSRNENVGVEDDSSMEVVEVLEDGLEEEELRKREKEEIVAKYMELDEKVGVGVEENPSSSSAVVVSGLTDGKSLKLLSLDGDVEVWDVDTSMPVYKKLYDTSNKRNDKLSRIQNEINFRLKKWDTLRLWRPAKKQEDVPSEAFLPLNKDEEKEVSYALSNAVRKKPLVTHENSNIQITGELLQCLRPGAWLNDEVINVYLELLKERERREPKKYLKCHFFNTFFYKKLIGGRGGYDYKAVRRWTTQRKLGYCLNECDKIFVPVHKEIHWCLAVINKKDGKFQYLDSLGGGDRQVMKVLAQYIVDEVKDKSGIDIDVTSWKQEFVKDLPNQQNGFDCGMFMIKYVDFYSRDAGLCFNQEHMPYFRRRTVKEILRLKAD